MNSTENGCRDSTASENAVSSRFSALPRFSAPVSASNDACCFSATCARTASISFSATAAKSRATSKSSGENSCVRGRVSSMTPHASPATASGCTAMLASSSPTVSDGSTRLRFELAAARNVAPRRRIRSANRSCTAAGSTTSTRLSDSPSMNTAAPSSGITFASAASTRLNAVNSRSLPLCDARSDSESPRLRRTCSRISFASAWSRPDCARSRWRLNSNAWSARPMVRMIDCSAVPIW